MTALRLALSELRRLTSGRLPRLALAAIALIPTLYAGLYLFANHDPYGNLDRVPAALVVQDDGAHGRQVADQLLRDGGFGWQEVATPSAADQGVRDGRYDAALVIGPTFSADLESAGRLAPHQASLTMITDDTNSYLARTIAEQIVDQVRDGLATQVGTQAAQTFLDGFAQFHDQLAEAASGASTLAGGTAQLADGVAQADAGAHQTASGAAALADGATRLADGASTASAGAKSLAGGASQAADGAASLADGLATLRDKTATLPDQARALADGAAQVAAGDATVAGYGDQVRAAAGQVLPALDQVRSDVDARLDAAVAAGTITADQAAALRTQLTPVLDDGRTRVAGVVTQVKDATGRLDDLAAGATQVSDGVAALADAAPALADGIAQAADGAAALRSGTAQVSDGAGSLAGGVATLASGAHDLAGGAAQLGDGTSALASGTDALSTGAHQAATGSAQLRDGLEDGVAQVPNPDAVTRSATAKTIGDPVAVTTVAHDAAGTYGAGLAPFFLSLASWIGAYVMFLVVKPLSRRALAAGRGVAAAVGGWLVPAAIGVAQAAVMFSVTRWALHIDVAHGLGTALFLPLVAATFVAIVQLLNVWLGAAGQFLGLVLMLVQLVTAGGTFPWQTIPEPLRSIHRFLPMSWSVDGLRHLLYGGSLTSVAVDAAMLAAVGTAALVGTAVLARRQRTWTASRLEPELVL